MEVTLYFIREGKGITHEQIENISEVRASTHHQTVILVYQDGTRLERDEVETFTVHE